MLNKVFRLTKEDSRAIALRLEYKVYQYLFKPKKGSLNEEGLPVKEMVVHTGEDGKFPDENPCPSIVGNVSNEHDSRLIV